MELAGWNVNVQTDSPGTTNCGNTTFVGFYNSRLSDDGTLNTMFQGSGRASLSFGTCE